MLLDDVIKLPSLQLSSLLPSSSHYYRYMGSMTTPPCAPLIWTMFKDFVYLSEKQVSGICYLEYLVYLSEKQVYVNGIFSRNTLFRYLSEKQINGICYLEYCTLVFIRKTGKWYCYLEYLVLSKKKVDTSGICYHENLVYLPEKNADE